MSKPDKTSDNHDTPASVKKSEKICIKASDTFEKFRTQRAYLNNIDGLSGSMEDYLEMIYRISKEGVAVRIKELSARLNVSPSSASKMASLLKTKGLVSFEKYGYITLTEKGRVTGEYLYRRHKIINRFLCLLNGTSDELAETEKIEHYLRPETVSNMEKYLMKIK